MVAALGIAASLLSDVGFKALKSLTSGKSGSSTTQAGITDPSVTTGQNVPAGSFGTGSANLSTLFSKIDSDGNGSISKDEFMAFKQQVDSTLSALLKTQEQSASSAATNTTSGTADKLFSKLDTNGDGSLSKDELQNLLNQRHHRHHGTGGTDQANAAGGSTGADGSGQQGGTDDSPASFLTALLNLQSSASASS